MWTENRTRDRMWNAVTSGQLTTIDERCGVDINDRFFEGNNYLLAAVSCGQIGSLKALLRGCADVNVQRDDGMSPLNYASVRGSTEMVKILIDNGADVESRDDIGRTPLFNAARCGRTEVVRLLTGHGAIVNTRMTDGTSALMAACHLRHDTVVTVLLDNGAEVDAKDHKRWTPLHWAASEGRTNTASTHVNLTTASCVHTAVLSQKVDTVRALLSAGADVNAKNEDGASPLHMASEKGYADIVQTLLGGHAQVEDRDNSGRTPLLLATITGRLPVIKALIEHGADVNSRFAVGNCYLTEASLSRQTESVKALLRAGANTNAQRDDGMSPLNVTSALGAIDIVTALLDNGADIESRDNAGRTPLFSAVHNGHLAVVTLLFERGSTVCKLDDGSSALADACFMGRSDIVRLMLDKGADVNCRNTAGYTPLYYAALQGHVGIVESLLSRVDLARRDKFRSLLTAVLNKHADIVRILTSPEAGHVDVNETDTGGISPLHLASLSGYVDVVKVLLNSNAQVDVGDNSGWTPLYHASRNGHADVVDLLLVSGADPNSRTNDNNSSLTAAVYSENTEVVRALLRAGATVRTPHSDGVSALHVACEEGCADMVNELLHKDAEVNIKDVYDRTPLFCAAQEGHTDVVQLLIDEGADVNNSCLLDAVLSGHIDVVSVLVSAGADVNLQQKDGTSPLHAACQEGNIGIIKILLYGGEAIDKENEDSIIALCMDDSESDAEVEQLAGDVADNQLVVNDAAVSINDLILTRVLPRPSVNSESNDVASLIPEASENGSGDSASESPSNNVDIDIRNQDGCTPLHYASENGHVDAAQLLLAAGANVSLTACDNTSCLLAATFNGHLDVVRVLLFSRADVNTQSDDGCSPLSFACEHGYVDVIRLLLDSHAEIEARDKDGRTPLIIAANFGQTDVVRVLVSAGGDVNAQGYDGAYAIHVASGQGHLEIVSALLGKNADLEVRDKDGYTPLMFAASYGRTEVVRALVSAKVVVDKANKYGLSALSFASLNGHVDIVNLLLDSRAQVDIRDCDGETPLRKAAAKGHVPVIEALIARGADVDAVDYDRHSALCAAAMKGHADAVLTLVRHGANVRFQDGDCTNPVSVTILLSRNSVEQILQMLITSGAEINTTTSSLNETALMCTPYKGGVDSAHLLIQRGADIHARNLENLQTVDLAGYCGQVELVKFLSGYDKCAIRSRNTHPLPLSGSRIDCHCNTALHVTCDLESMKSLLESGTDVESENVDGVRPLHCAARTGLVELVAMLIQYGANVNAADAFGNRPLHEAAASREATLVELLVRSGAELNVQNIDGKTPLHVAVERRQRDIVAFLLRQDINVALTDLWRNTPLHYVDGELLGAKGVAESVARLLSMNHQYLRIPNSIDVSIEIHMAIQSTIIFNSKHFCTTEHIGNILVVCGDKIMNTCETENTLKGRTYPRNEMALLKAASHYDSLGNTPVHYAVGVYGKMKMFRISVDVTSLVEFLVKSGASINAQNNEGRTPLHVAIGEEAVKACLLYANDDSFTVSDNRGRNFWHLLFICRSASDTELERTILPLVRTSDFKSLYKIDDLSRTPLHYACIDIYGWRFWRNRIGKEFIENASGEQINMKDVFGRTALHYAAIANNDKLQNLLKKKHADDTIRDSFDLTASDYARLQSKVGKKIPFLRMTNTSSFVTRFFRSISVFIGHCLGDKFDGTSKYEQELTNLIHDMRGSVDCTEYVLNTYRSSRFVYIDIPSRTPMVYHEMGNRNTEKIKEQLMFSAIQSHVDAAMRFLAEELAARDSRFACEVFSVGSGHEGTKVGRCDEFDYNFVLTHLSKICRVDSSPESPPGFVLLKTSTPEYDEDLFDSNGTLNTRIVKFKFETLVKSILSSAHFCLENHFEFIDPVLDNILPDGKVSTRLNTRIEISFTMPVNGLHVLHGISLDIVPAVCIKDWLPDDIRRTDMCQPGDCRIVFNQPQSKYPWIGWTEPHGFVSFAAAEGKLLRSCPPVVRAASMVVKRMSSYFCQYKFFPSYVIKTALLWCLDEEGFSSCMSSSNDSNDVDADELLRLVQNILRRLMRFAAQDYVPSFFLPKCHQPVWLNERYLKQFHMRLHQHGLTYEDLFCLNEQQSQDYWLQYIKSLFVCSHVMYWSVLPDSDSHELFYPSVNDPFSDHCYNPAR